MSEENQSCSQLPNAEPTATRSTVPMWIIVVTLLLVFLGFVFFDKHSGWFDPQVYAPYGTAEQLADSQPVSDAAKMFMVGKKNFTTFCATCHGDDGMGKPGQAPPLAGSEIVNAKGFHRLCFIPLEGLNGPIKIKGQEWSLNMAAMGAALPDADLAAVITYIRGSWGNKASDVSADDIKSIRAEIKTPAQIQGPSLLSIPE